MAPINVNGHIVWEPLGLASPLWWKDSGDGGSPALRPHKYSLAPCCGAAGRGWVQLWGVPRTGLLGLGGSMYHSFFPSWGCSLLERTMLRNAPFVYFLQTQANKSALPPLTHPQKLQVWGPNLEKRETICKLANLRNMQLSFRQSGMVTS